MNISIENLRALLVAAHPQDPSIRRSDKAELLEEAVRHLTFLQTRPNRQNAPASSNHDDAYASGVQDCTREVARYLSGTGRASIQTITQLGTHLRTTCIRRPDQHPARAPGTPRTAFAASPQSTSTPFQPRDHGPVVRSLPVMFNRNAISPVNHSGREHPFPPSTNNTFSIRFTTTPSRTGSLSPASSTTSSSSSDCSSSVVSTSGMSISEDSSDMVPNVSGDEGNDAANAIMEDERPWRPW
ncbi:uncharacterized protein LOC128203657 isoform X2 [Mya arenaria]|nr:uncharacterized protein LOC128203657 isoform X2 [Mya arenaria]